MKPSVEPPPKKARASEALNVSLEFDAETLDSEPAVRLQEVLLTGKAAQKELKYCDLSPQQRVVMLKAMAREWDKWTEFKASRFLTEAELQRILKQNPHQKIVGTRWVLTPKGADYKARLVVQGCQEDKTYIRSDAPTGSRDAFFLTLAFGSQKGWKVTSFDAQSAYLQSDGISRLLLIRMPWQNPPPGTQPGQVLVATGSIYGTCDAGRGWYLYSKEVFKSEGCLESRPKGVLSSPFPRRRAGPWHH